MTWETILTVFVISLIFYSSIRASLFQMAKQADEELDDIRARLHDLEKARHPDRANNEWEYPPVWAEGQPRV